MATWTCSEKNNSQGFVCPREKCLIVVLQPSADVECSRGTSSAIGQVGAMTISSSRRRVLVLVCSFHSQLLKALTSLGEFRCGVQCDSDHMAESDCTQWQTWMQQFDWTDSNAAEKFAAFGAFVIILWMNMVCFLKAFARTWMLWAQKTNDLVPRIKPRTISWMSLDLKVLGALMKFLLNIDPPACKSRFYQKARCVPTVHKRTSRPHAPESPNIGLQKENCSDDSHSPHFQSNVPAGTLPSVSFPSLTSSLTSWEGVSKQQYHLTVSLAKLCSAVGVIWRTGALCALTVRRRKIFRSHSVSLRSPDLFFGQTVDNPIQF